MAYDIGPRIGIDGEKEFKSALAAINSEIKNLNSEMKASVTSMNGMQSAEESAAKKADILARAIEAGKSKIEVLQGQYDRSKEKLEQLAKALDDAKREFGENSDEALKAEVAYNKQAKTVNDLGTQLNKAKAEVNEMTKEMADGAKDADKLDDELEDVSKSAEKAGDAGTKLGTIFKGAFFANIATAALSKLKDALVGAARGMIDAAAEYKAATAQFEQTFGDLQETAKQTLSGISKETGIVAERLRGPASSIYAFTRALGGDAATSLNIMERATRAAADSAAYYDRTLEETTETILAYIKGNYANDAALGFASTATTRNAAALELFNKQFSELTEIQKEEALLHMVEQANELSGAIGQAARESDSWLNVTENLRAKWQTLLAQVGTPVLESLTPVIQDLTDKLTVIVDKIDWEKFADRVSTVLNFIIDNAGAVAAGLGIIAGGFLAVSVAASPLTILAVALAACIAQTVILKKKIEEMTGVDIPAWASTFFAAVAGGPTLAMGMLKKATEDEEKTAEGWRNTHFRTAAEVAQVSIETSAAMGEAFSNAGTKIKGVFEDLKTAGAALKDNLKNTAKILGDEFSAMGDKIKGKFNDVVATLKGIPQQVYQIGVNIVTGLWNGIKDKFSWLVNQIKSFARNVVDQLKGFFGIHSPSTVMRDEVGENLALGIASGITAGIPAIKGALGMVTDATLASGIMAPAPRVSAPDIERVGSGIVNGLNAGNSGGRISIEVPLVINGREFARAVLSDFRAVENASPAVAYG